MVAVDRADRSVLGVPNLHTYVLTVGSTTDQNNLLADTAQSVDKHLARRSGIVSTDNINLLEGEVISCCCTAIEIVALVGCVVTLVTTLLGHTLIVVARVHKYLGLAAVHSISTSDNAREVAARSNVTTAVVAKVEDEVVHIADLGTCLLEEVECLLDLVVERSIEQVVDHVSDVGFLAGVGSRLVRVDVVVEYGVLVVCSRSSSQSCCLGREVESVPIELANLECASCADGNLIVEGVEEQILVVVHINGCAVNLADEVTTLQASLLGGRVGVDILYGEVQVVAVLIVLHGVNPSTITLIEGLLGTSYIACRGSCALDVRVEKPLLLARAICVEVSVHAVGRVDRLQRIVEEVVVSLIPLGSAHLLQVAVPEVVTLEERPSEVLVYVCISTLLAYRFLLDNANLDLLIYALNLCREGEITRISGFVLDEIQNDVVSTGIAACSRRDSSNLCLRNLCSPRSICSDGDNDLLSLAANLHLVFTALVGNTCRIGVALRTYGAAGCKYESYSAQSQFDQIFHFFLLVFKII